MKNIFLSFLFAIPLLFLLPSHTFAQSSSIPGNHVQSSDGDFVPLAPIPGLTDQHSTRGTVLSGNFGDFFNSLYQYLIGLSVALAIVWIIWGGILISTSDSVGNHQRGKDKIWNALFGLALVLAPALVFSIINKSILNLSVNFSAIDLSTPQQQQQTPPASNTPAGCDSSSMGKYVSASCANYLIGICQQGGNTYSQAAQNQSSGGTLFKITCTPPVTSSTTFVDQADCAQHANTTNGQQPPYYWHSGTCADAANQSIIHGQPNPSQWTCTPGMDNHVCIYQPKS